MVESLWSVRDRQLQRYVEVDVRDRLGSSRKEIDQEGQKRRERGEDEHAEVAQLRTGEDRPGGLIHKGCWYPHSDEPQP